MDMDHGHAPQHPGPPDPPGGHGMAVVGTDAVYLSHLPMFMRPHNYQVILEASFGKADTAFRKDRKAHPATKLYTFAPAPFVLPDLFPSADGHPPSRTSFDGQLVRNHFEQPPAHPEVPELVASGVVVKVARVVHQHRLDAAAARPKNLAYLLFGKGAERFVAHLIAGPPDFDQLVSVEVRGRDFTDAELAKGVALSVPKRKDTPKTRVKEGETVAATALVDGKAVPVELAARTELYFETSDLMESM